MNLLERLKPEIKVVLNKELELYPTITQRIVDELTSNKYVIDVKYGTATAIQYWHLIATNEVAKDLFNCFNDQP